MPVVSQSDTPVGQWLRTLVSRGIHRNVAIVALAIKLARIAWAICVMSDSMRKLSA